VEDQVPENHLLWLIDKHIRFEFVQEHLKDSYSETGRPSIDPETPAAHAAPRDRIHPTGVVFNQQASFPRSFFNAFSTICWFLLPLFLSTFCAIPRQISSWPVINTDDHRGFDVLLRADPAEAAADACHTPRCSRMSGPVRRHSP
jgi:hypothetical protein